MEINETKKLLEEIEADVHQKKILLNKIDKEQKKQQLGLLEIVDTIEKNGGNILEKDIFLSFFKKPYTVIPFGKNKVLIAVPKFVKNFQVGWLWKETESFYIYQFDQYSAWLSDAPKELLAEINFKENFSVGIDGNILQFDPEQKALIKQKFGYHLSNIEYETAKIKRGHIFDVIAESI